jgi:hypothetical protein
MAPFLAGPNRVLPSVLDPGFWQVAINFPTSNFPDEPIDDTTEIIDRGWSSSIRRRNRDKFKKALRGGPPPGFIE